MRFLGSEIILIQLPPFQIYGIAAESFCQQQNKLYVIPILYRLFFRIIDQHIEIYGR